MWFSPSSSPSFFAHSVQILTAGMHSMSRNLTLKTCNFLSLWAPYCCSFSVSELAVLFFPLVADVGFSARDAFVEERQEEPKRRHSHHDALLQEIQDQSETKFSEESSSVSSTDEAREQGVLHQENSPVLCAPITARNLSDHRNSFTAEVGDTTLTVTLMCCTIL